MKKVTITAVFTGANGSCGYENGKEYTLQVTMYKSDIKITPVFDAGPIEPIEKPVPYESIFSFYSNWDNIKVQAHGFEDARELTFGEKAVGISFNPGGSDVVNRIKRKNANLIDLYQDQRQIAIDKKQGDKVRMFAQAITDTQAGQMWGVKADTWQYN